MGRYVCYLFLIEFSPYLQILLIIVISMVQASNYVAVGGIHAAALLYGIVIGYLIVYLILIVCYLIGETSSQRSKFVSISRWVRCLLPQ